MSEDTKFLKEICELLKVQNALLREVRELLQEVVDATPNPMDVPG